MQGIERSNYNPDLIPMSADGSDDVSYNPETGFVAQMNEPMDEEEFRYTVFQGH